MSNKLNRLCLLTGAALGALAAQSAFAEDPVAAPDKVIVLGAPPAYTQDATRTATRTETPLKDVPQTVTVITSDLMADQAMRSMADVLRNVPGASIGQGEGHRDAPTLRGNSSTADFFVDGVRDDVQYFRDLYNSERIEILMGPNAMVFGRGGGGGVINRVTKSAQPGSVREVTLQYGEHGQRRAAIDFGGEVAGGLSLRLNTVYENSDSYRDGVDIERFGFNPTAAVRLGEDTVVHAGFERFTDNRTVDRGAPSRNGRPFEGDVSIFYGNPVASNSEFEVDQGRVIVEHAFGDTLSLRNQTVLADYSKSYSNVHPGSAVSTAGTLTLQAYSSSGDRRNLFNQTDLVWRGGSGFATHTVLTGMEFGRQESFNTRTPNLSAGVVSAASPTLFGPVSFGTTLQTHNEVVVDVASAYLQDQVKLGRYWEVVAGLRYDRFDLAFDDRRAANADQARTDETVSPRAGVVFKPTGALSLYGSYSVSFLPQSGDQFGSLDATTSRLDPEEFVNTELGLKWNLSDALALTAALYRLDRTNTRATDPVTTLTVLTGEQRSEGVEVGLAGAITDRWRVIGGVAVQNAEITKTTTAAPAGRKAALVPEQTFSLWSTYQIHPRLEAGLGVVGQSDMFASISNAVVLPGFTRVDGSLQVALTDRIEAQVNFENLLDETYWPTSHGDNNITPGAPRTVRLTLRSRF